MNPHNDIAHLIKAGLEKAALRKAIEDLKAERDELQAKFDRLSNTDPTTITGCDVKADPAWAVAVFRHHRERDRAELKHLKDHTEHKVYIKENQYGGVIRKPTQKDGWLPIETAPQDGTEVLCFCVEPEFEGEDNPYTCFKVCFWGMQTEDHSCWMSNYGYEQHPTHWMALPNPPSPTL